LHGVKFHTTFPGMDDARTLAEQIEAVAARLNVAPSTVGERVGQGGQFYSRLRSGKRVWPDTAARVRERLAALEAQAPGDAA
jgi:hypothetical protein